MADLTVFTPDDDLFGRVALFNKLVTTEQIEECARTMTAGAAAGTPGHTLAVALVARGFLSSSTAEAVAEAVRKRTAAAAGKATAKKAPAPAKAAPAEVAPLPAAAPVMKKRARPGDSQVVVPVESGHGPKGERVWVSVSERERTATLKIDCLHAYPTDAPRVAEGCRRLLETGQLHLFVDMRKPRYVPSVVIGEVARACLDAQAAGRQVVLLCNQEVANLAQLVLGETMEIRIS